jgi:hypothetical protein
MSAPLAERQREFAEWLLAREAPAATVGLIGDDRASAAERLHVYRYAYMSRLVGVMRDDFPTLERALGRARFDPLAAAYLRAQPSRHFSLRQLGARFPAFLAEPSRTHALDASAPWAAELARLELAVTDAFDARDAQSLSRADLTALPPEYWDDLALDLIPGARLLELSWPVRALRAARDAEQPLTLEGLAPQPERVLVWRRDERVLHRECSAEEHALLARVASGTRFGALCALAAEARGEEAGAAFAASSLAQWVEDGVLRGSDDDPSA